MSASLPATSDGPENIQKRLRELEKQIRRFKQIVSGVLVVAAVIVVMGQASAKKTIDSLRTSGRMSWFTPTKKN